MDLTLGLLLVAAGWGISYAAYHEDSTLGAETRLLIESCEKDLPRSQHCVPAAVVAKKNS